MQSTGQGASAQGRSFVIHWLWMLFHTMQTALGFTDMLISNGLTEIIKNGCTGVLISLFRFAIKANAVQSDRTVSSSYRDNTSVDCEN